MYEFLKTRKSDPIIFAFLGFFVSVIYLIETSDFPHRTIQVADAFYYAQAAKNFFSNTAATWSSFSLSKFYLIYLALIYELTKILSTIFGRLAPIEIVCYLNAVYASLSVGLAVWFAGQYSRVAGMITGVLLLGFGPFYFFQGVNVPIIPATFLGAVAMVLYAYHAKAAKIRYLIISAIVLGLALDFRPHFMIIIPAVALQIVIRDKTNNVKRRIYTAVSYIVLALLPVALLTFVMPVAEGDASVPVRSSVGFNLFVGNHYGASGTYCKIAGINNEPGYFLESSKKMAESIAQTKLTDEQVNTFWARNAIYFYIKKPIEGIKLIAHKVQHLISYKEFPINYDYGVHRQFSKTLKLLVFNFGLLMPLAIIGLIFNAKDETLTRCKLWFVAYSASMLIFFVASDHRLPLVIPAAILASLGIITIYNSIMEGQYRRFGVIMVVLLVFILISISDSVGWSHQQTYQQLGEMSLDNNRLDLALEAFQMALNEEPDYLPALRMLGWLNFKSGDYMKSSAYFAKAVSLAPENIKYRQLLSLSLYKLGDLDSAANVIEPIVANNKPVEYLDSLIKIYNTPDNAD
jgi:tetratricopeptide (TPR) repeat protein